ncbi:MAG TPA: hypothetical protein VII11_04670 [Bacteroidota bacterium]
MNPTQLVRSKTPQPGVTLASWLSAVPDFALGAVFLVTWVAPYTFGELMVSYLVLVMLMEFIIIHSSVFLGSVFVADTPKRKKSLTLIGVGMFYTLFVGGFSLAFGEWWPLVAFWAMIVNRLLGVLLGKAPTGTEKDLLRKSWATNILWYLVFAFVTILLPMPEFGISSAVIARQDFSSEGIWIDEPYRAAAFGFLYFTAVGLTELYSYRWPHIKLSPAKPD